MEFSSVRLLTSSRSARAWSSRSRFFCSAPQPRPFQTTVEHMESQEAEQQNRRSLEEIDMLNFNNTRLTKRVEGLMERCLASGCMRPDAHARSHAWTERLDERLETSVQGKAQPLGVSTAHDRRKWSSSRRRGGRRGLAAGPANRPN